MTQQQRAVAQDPVAYQHILYEVSDKIATITLNRPDRMNAFNRRMCEEVEELWRVIKADDDVRAVILTGGKMVFCAGMDVKEMAALAEGEIDDYFKTLANSLKKIYLFRKPVIAGVGGIALGLSLIHISEPTRPY